MNETPNPTAGNLAGRHALVSGGGRGIGAAIARELDALGAGVTLLGRSLPALEEVAATLTRGFAVCADVTDAAAVAAALAAGRERHGPVSILVNNAGVAESAPLLKTDTAMWRTAFAVNVEGAFNLCRLALPDMLAEDWGRIINVASTAGLRGYPYVAAYCASKHALIGLTRALAMEYVRHPITVNAICPGYVETEMLHRSIDNIVAKTGSSEADAAERLRSVNPQQRFIQPGEIAATVRWLCLPGSESVTGQSVALAGGEIQ